MDPTSSLTILEISAIFLSITALLTYVNHRFIGLPTTIGVMVISILLSIGAIFLGFLTPLSTSKVIEKRRAPH